MPSSPTAETPSSQAVRSRTRRPRKPLNCNPCRESKLRCDRQYPCGACKRRKLVNSCIYTNASSRAPTIAAPRAPPLLSPAEPQAQTPRLLSPRPDRDVEESQAASEGHARWDAVFERPTNQLCDTPVNDGSADNFPAGNSHFPFSIGPPVPKTELLAILPPKECCDYLISQYFLRLSPLFHVLHGPTFQKQYNEFLDNPLGVNLAWLALLFTILSMTLNTMEGSDTISMQLWSQDRRYQDLPAVASQFRKSAMLCLSEDQFLIRHSLNTLEALLILIYGMSHNDGVEQTWVLLGKNPLLPRSSEIDIDV